MVHFNVTANPTADWTTQQIIETFPDDEAPKDLRRDRDSIHGKYFPKPPWIKQVVTAPRAPFQKA